MSAEGPRTTIEPALASAVSVNAASCTSDSSAFTLVYDRDSPKDGVEPVLLAKVFLDAKYLDNLTLSHIRGQVKSSVLSHVRLMPDTHIGTGCCVGLTSKLTSRIVPSLIGGDIGCGVLSYPLGKLPLRGEKSLAQIDSIIRRLVPLGATKGHIHDRAVVTNTDMINICSSAQADAEAFAVAYEAQFGVSLADVIPTYSLQWFEQTCKRVHANRDIVQRGLGTLGGGNHFLEIDVNSEGVHFMTVHCGSRGFGKAVCDFHQKRIYDAKTFDHHAFQQAKKQLKQLKKSDAKAYEKAIAELEQKICDKAHPPYLEGVEAYEYYFDMIFAQHYAQLNRDLILRRIHADLTDWCSRQADGFELEPFDPLKKIESIHNFISFQDFIVRKGAIPAKKDELCLVALNMRDGLLLCRGKGNDDWNQSCAHGCGRIMSREQAMKQLDMNTFVSSMQGIFSTSINKQTLDESPQAYKDSDLIRRTITHTVDIVEQLKPILNIKANSV